MQSFSLKIGAVIFLLAVLGGVIFLLLSGEEEKYEPPVAEETIVVVEPKSETLVRTIGTSVEDRAIEAHTYGNGDTGLLFVGGVHGGYEWNSVFLAYRFMDYLEENLDAIPKDLSITVIPSMNPDGTFDVVGVEGRFSVDDAPDITDPSGIGRFNVNEVDLNRNFGCKWKPESTWRGSAVSAGTESFSEPEALAFRDFVLEEEPVATIFWHSQGSAVYASECEDGILPETLTLMNTYSTASGYQAFESFDAYEITGDAEGWLASVGIPAITVELSTHETIEWEKNLAGIQALFTLYTEEK